MKILLLLYLSAAASASPGPAGATAHQSYSRVYSTPHDPSHRISIVKSDRDGGEDAYVASDFYRRVRDKRRLANSRIGERGRGGGPDGVDGDCDGDGSCRAGVDHSLDHYFDHDITRPSHSRGEGATAPKASARGGSGPSPPSRPSSPRDDRGGHYANPRRVRGGGGSPSADADAAGHHRIHQASHVHSHRDDFVAEHHLGLLRVPCSIALNANEASLGHQLSNQVEGRVNVQATTPVAAYVDTGAQVTIISASAAKRAGIYHLIDRRYAGRATGVGHCKVLGRIPARHVYFNLGEDYEDSAGHFEDMRGGGDLLDDIFEDWDDPDEDSDDRRPGSSSSSNSVQMDGPALTVLEGTVTPGVDVLLGLDVLQDWEAEIRMGSKQSITVKKRRRGSASFKSGNSSVVIPFSSRASSSSGVSSAQGRQVRGGAASRQRRQQDHARPRIPASDRYRRGSAARRHRPSEAAGPPDARRTRRDGGEDERYYLSPRSSAVESDLDLLDQTSPEFPSSGGGGRLTQMKIDEVEEGLSRRGARRADVAGPGDGSGLDTPADESHDDDEDDYSPDVEEEDTEDEEFDCDMSGL